MSPTAAMEVAFNIAYLVAIWALVVMMITRHARMPAAGGVLRRWFIIAFGLLALGDTGHVGFRVLGYASGNLEAVTVPGTGIGLVGLGAFFTAFTVTLFYVCALFAWRERFAKPLGAFGAVLIVAAVVRLIVMLFPQNDWSSSVPPQPWSLYRNLPLMLLGLGVAYLVLRDATKASDRPFKWIGDMILVSYAFYTPVILFVQIVPVVGMLMIPKTLAYVAIAAIGYRSLFSPQSAQRAAPVLSHQA